MNRFDQKFWFDAGKIIPLLEALLPFYHILEIDQKRLIGYQTVYFDTTDNEMYIHHHNGYRPRFKIRRRKYETSEHGFFEIKCKTNKQRVLKKRIEVPYHTGNITDTERCFLKDNSPYGNKTLTAVIRNHFKRLTLINKDKSERCTVDIHLGGENEMHPISLDELVILELKRKSLLEPSPLTKLLKHFDIRQPGLSKYCMGRALLETELKSNAFKSRLNVLQKKIIKNHLYV